MSTSFAVFLISAMILVLPRITTYSGVNPCSTSTPILLLGRSMMWPTDAFTVKPEPRYFLMVFAFAGDSTTTSALSRLDDAFATFFSLEGAVAVAFLVFATAFAIPTSIARSVRRTHARQVHPARDRSPPPRPFRSPCRRGTPDRRRRAAPRRALGTGGARRDRRAAT